MEESINFAVKYIEDLLSFFGLNTAVSATRDDDTIQLNIPSTHMNGFLIGSHAETLRALQNMVNTALKSSEHEYARVYLDVADYKKQRAERLANQAEDWIKEVKSSGEIKHLHPMNAADRRTVHQVAADNGLETESEGEGRDRHIVLKPPADEDDQDGE